MCSSDLAALQAGGRADHSRAPWTLSWSLHARVVGWSAAQDSLKELQVQQCYGAARGTIPSGRRHVNRSRWQSGEAQSRPCRNFRCSRTRPGSTRSGRRPRPEDAELKASRTTTTGIDSAKNLAWTERTGRPTGARPYRRTASSRARQASYSKPRPFDFLIDGWAFCGNDPEIPACTRRARPHLAAPANRRHTPTCKCQQPHACPEPGVMLPTRSERPKPRIHPPRS